MGHVVNFCGVADTYGWVIYKRGDWKQGSTVSPVNYDEFANIAQLIREHFRPLSSQWP